MTKKIVTGILLCLVFFTATFGALLVAPEQVYAQQQQQQKKESPPALCSILPSWLRGSSNGNFGGCIAYIFYYLFVGVSSPFLFLGGYAFDISVGMALDSGMLGGKGISKTTIETGWGIVRNVANMVFIFLLIYIAIVTILSIQDFNTYRTLVLLVVVALLINFSLFAARVVIDASNLLALQFYNSIRQTSPDQTVAGITVAVRPVSGAVMQALGTSGILNEEVKIGTGQSTFSALSDLYNKKLGAGEDFVFLSALFVLLGITNIVSAFVLFAAAFLFIGRIIALWILMILAPIGFIAFILPQTSAIAKRWWSMLFSQAFLAPVFLFLFYIFLIFLVPGAVSNVTGAIGGESFVDRMIREMTKALSSKQGATLETFWQLLAQFVITFGIAIAFLIAILKVTQSMSGQMGTQLVKGATASGRWIAGVSGRNTFGRVAHYFSSPETGVGKKLQGLVRASPRLGGLLYGGLRKTAGFGFGAKGKQQGFSDKVDAQSKGMKERVDFALKGLEGQKRIDAAQRMLKKISQPFGGIQAPTLLPGQQLIPAATQYLGTSTGSKEFAAERLRVLGKASGDTASDIEKSARRFGEAIGRIEAELGTRFHAQDRELVPKVSAREIARMNKEGLKDLSKRLERSIERHEGDYAALFEARRIEADRTGNYPRMGDLIALEKTNTKNINAMKDLRNTIKKLVETEEKKS